MNQVIATFGAQTFEQKQATIARISKFTNTNATEDGEVESRTTYWVQLKDGAALPVSLDNLSRAVGRVLDDRSLVLLHGGDITYIESQRKAGLPFKWRHTDDDKAALIATKDATFVTVDAIEPLDSRFGYVLDLPIYEVHKTVVTAAPSQTHDNAPEPDNDIPAGAKIVDTPSNDTPAGNKATNPAKVGKE